MKRFRYKLLLAVLCCPTLIAVICQGRARGQPCLCDHEREGDADGDAELADEDAAMVREPERGPVADPPPQQAAHSCGPQQQRHLQAGREIRHAQQLEVEREEDHAAPGDAAHDALQFDF